MEKLIPCPDTLYLMEFVVDSISIRKLETHYRSGKSGILFQFLDNTVEINEEEFADRSVVIGKRKVGKSCLFSISSHAAQAANDQFMIDIKLYFRRGMHETKVCIATSNICITNLYNQIRMFMLEDNSTLPVSRSLKNAYTLRDYSSRPIGVVRFYLRLSCLGNSIVTQFELGECDSSQRWEFEMPRSATAVPSVTPITSAHASFSRNKTRSEHTTTGGCATKPANQGRQRKTKRRTDGNNTATLITKRYCHECSMGDVAAWAEQCQKFVEPVKTNRDAAKRRQRSEATKVNDIASDHPNNIHQLQGLGLIRKLKEQEPASGWGGLTTSEYKMKCVSLALDEFEKKERLARLSADNIASSAYAMHSAQKRLGHFF